MEPSSYCHSGIEHLISLLRHRSEDFFFVLETLQRLLELHALPFQTGEVAREILSIVVGESFGRILPVPPLRSLCGLVC